METVPEPIPPFLVIETGAGYELRAYFQREGIRLETWVKQPEVFEVKRETLKTICAIASLPGGAP